MTDALRIGLAELLRKAQMQDALPKGHPISCAKGCGYLRRQ